LFVKDKKNHTLHAWMICAIAAIFYCYEYLLRISPSVMEPALRSHFDLTATGFGVLSSLYYYAYVPMQLPVGVMMDRYGPQRLLTLACLICVIGTFLFAGTDLIWVAGVGRFLVGFGSAFAFVGVLKLATIWLPENKLGMVSGLASALGAVGAMSGDNLLDAMVESLGWQQTINISGVFGVGLIFLLWYGIRDDKQTKHEVEEGTVHSFKDSMKDLGIIARNKQIWINGLYGCLVYLPATVFAELWGIPYLKNAHGLTQSSSGFANSLLFLGFTLGAPMMGLLSDRLGRRKPPMILGAILAAFIMTVVIYVPGLSENSIYLLMFALGISYSAQCLVFAVSRELSPNEAAGTAMAMTNMIVMLGAMLLQPVIGRLLDFSLSFHHEAGVHTDNLAQLYSAGDYQLALSIIPIGIVIAAILVCFLKETYAHTRD
jgi:MFS family permease